ncbi:CDC42EP5 isoform 1 [Pongo abelii]|uniref:CDC42EP5 isoform 1 n=1 Tax=Pongo abelii TaxID=9601 RepID=A0A2J8QYX7_PONAB|nr:CDC42EP5 isoform 1 [Pongo abelii]
MPVLKQLGPAQPKKRPDRGALSISAPLGDFRTRCTWGAAATPSGTPPPPGPLPPNADLELDDVIGL